MKNLIFALSAVLLSSCTLGPVASDPQFEYANAQVYKNLEVPPDLTIEHTDTYSIPGIDELNSAAPDYQNTKLVRNNQGVWLELTGEADLVWTRLHNFLNLQGIKIETSDKLTGLITSEWLNNQTGIASGNLLDNLQSSFISNNYLDQYVISVEREDDNKVKVAVLHNGLTKVVFDNDKQNSISEKWIKSAPNKALPLTLLKKFMAYSGLSIKVGMTGFNKQDLANLFKDKVLQKTNNDHFIIVKKQSKRVFNNLQKQLLNLYNVEKIRSQSGYIVINEPYQSVRLANEQTPTKAKNSLIRIQVLKTGYQSKIVIRNNRGEAIDLATTEKLLNKIMTLNL